MSAQQYISGNLIFQLKITFRQVWINANMNSGGNWTSDGSLMITGLFSDMRSVGSWVPSQLDDESSTGNNERKNICAKMSTKKSKF